MSQTITQTLPIKSIRRSTSSCRSLASSYNPQKAIISLQNDRGTSYQMFVKVRNEILGAYSELRNDLSERKYGKAFITLNDEDRSEIVSVYPQFISEAEPVSIGK